MFANILTAGVTNGLVPLQEGALGALGAIFFLLPLLFFVIVVAGMWKVFEKAGRPGWEAIIPIYNIYILTTEIAGRGILWVVLTILFGIPFIIIAIDVAKAFGKGAGYGLGLFFLGFIFFPLLGFGDARFQGVPN